MKTSGFLPRLAALALAAVLAPACADIGEGDTPGEVNVLISVRQDGGSAEDESFYASISADGTIVAFQSLASNLTPGDFRDWQDAFAKDRTSSAVENLSDVPEQGIFPQANHDSLEPAVSANGTYVAFASRGVQIGGPLPASPQATRNAYVRNRVTGVLRRVINLPDPWPNEDIDTPSVSDDGRWVVFSTWAGNLSIPNGPKDFQVYLADMNAAPPSLTLVSHGTGGFGVLGAGDSTDPVISPDGEYVVFGSTANNLHVADVEMTPDIFLWRRSTGLIELVSRNTAGTKGNGASIKPDVSSDGRFVVFHTFAANLLPPASAGGVVRRERTGVAEGGTTLQVTENPGAPFPAFLAYEAPSVSDDGRFVAYTTNSLLLIPNLTPRQVFVRDMLGGERLVSQGFFGAFADSECLRAQLSGDGRWVAWACRASNLMANDTGGLMNIFARGPLR